MRKTDIIIGTEYAATAPLAYGREPNTAPRRVRFTSTKAGKWVEVSTRRYEPNRSGHKWVTTNQYLADMEVDLNLKSLSTYLPYGNVEPDQVVTIRSQVERGALPAEVYRPSQDDWVPALVSPSAVHRTWAEVQEKRDRLQVARERLAKDAYVPQINDLLVKLGLDGVIVAGLDASCRLSLHGTTKEGQLMYDRLVDIALAINPNIFKPSDEQLNQMADELASYGYPSAEPS